MYICDFKRFPRVIPRIPLKREGLQRGEKGGKRGEEEREG
jgi:hypothetical protein